MLHQELSSTSKNNQVRVYYCLATQALK
ncbi:hypothetical protein MTR67_039854 [Solanum verrucosum]|uniref:Uncharacterized protein n=1 Tax=Solanum verrucosum TaxID=315347 RepID=A0AAF0UJS2_SOLVR|nr:hypothetical protein MTR67_039854 [Solanum verrucosum]